MNDEQRLTDHDKAVAQNERLKAAMADIKEIPVREFREAGYLQELNRRFLHPLGMALEVVVHADGTESLGRIWDARDQPEGIVYDPTMLDPRKTKLVESEMTKRAEARADILGFIIQPD